SRPLEPPLICNLNDVTGTSGTLENVLTSAPLPLTEVVARRSRAICPRSGISSVGRVRIRCPWLNLIPWTRDPLPANGVDSGGVVAVTLPTIVFALQPTAPPWTAWAVANGHTTLLLLGSSARDSGSVTFAELMFACPDFSVRFASRVGWAPLL